MTSKLSLLAAAGVLAATMAAAQTPPPGNVRPGSQQSGAEQTGAPNQPRSPGGQTAQVVIAPEQRTVIREYVVRENVPRTVVRERVRVGATVSPDVVLREVPADWGPSVTRYRYFHSDAGIHFVDPTSREIVYELD